MQQQQQQQQQQPATPKRPPPLMVAAAGTGTGTLPQASPRSSGTGFVAASTSAGVGVVLGQSTTKAASKRKPAATGTIATAASGSKRATRGAAWRAFLETVVGVQQQPGTPGSSSVSASTPAPTPTPTTVGLLATKSRSSRLPPPMTHEVHRGALLTRTEAAEAFRAALHALSNEEPALADKSKSLRGVLMRVHHWRGVRDFEAHALASMAAALQLVVGSKAVESSLGMLLALLERKAELLPVERERFLMMLRLRLPQLYSFLVDVGLDPARWSGAWLGWGFAGQVSLRDLIRLWDAYISLGALDLHTLVCVAVLENRQDDLLDGSFYDVRSFLVRPTLDVDRVVVQSQSLAGEMRQWWGFSSSSTSSSSASSSSSSSSSSASATTTGGSSSSSTGGGSGATSTSASVTASSVSASTTT